MNHIEYERFEKEVEAFHTLNKLRPGLNSAKDGCHAESFSRSECGCCGTGQAGSRLTYVFAREDDREPIEEDICVDCVYYLAYGVLDDEQMDEIKASRQEAELLASTKATATIKLAELKLEIEQLESRLFLLIQDKETQEDILL